MDTLRGSLLMIASMAFFALEDMLLKLTSAKMPVGQMLLLLGAGGAVIFALLLRRHGTPLITAALLSRPVLIRNASEIVATYCFVTALALTPLSSTVSILQATPLMVTLGAALLLGAPVGWRRWGAILIGFAGVLMIVRPGFAGFSPTSLYAVVSVLAFAIRDLVTRATPRSVSSLQLATYGFATLVPLGALLLLIGPPPQPIDAATALTLVAMVGLGVLGYYAIVEAMRLGDVAAVTPFRYTRLIFALVISVTVFREHPDRWTLLGAAIIIASGLYSLTRERTLSYRRQRR